MVKWSVPALADPNVDEKYEESKWDAGKVRKVGEKGVTCFDVRSVSALFLYVINFADMACLLLQ